MSLRTWRRRPTSGSGWPACGHSARSARTSRRGRWGKIFYKTQKIFDFNNNPPEDGLHLPDAPLAELVVRHLAVVGVRPGHRVSQDLVQLAVPGQLGLGRGSIS